MAVLAHQSVNRRINGVFPQGSRVFIQVSEYREFDESLKHELGSVLLSQLHKGLQGRDLEYSFYKNILSLNLMYFTVQI